MPVVAINLGGAPTVKQASATSGQLNPAQGNASGKTSKAFTMLGLPKVMVWAFQEDATPAANPVVTLYLDGCVRPNLAGGGGVAKAREAWVELTSAVLVPGVQKEVIPLWHWPGMKVRVRIIASDVGGGLLATVPVQYIIGASA
jgi:hypothetical protein